MSSKVQIKICGINSNKSAEACNGADFIGFISIKNPQDLLLHLRQRKLQNIYRLI